MERYQGSLLEFINYEYSHNIPIEEIWVADIFTKILVSYRKLHQNHFIHLDTKLDNIFLLNAFTPVLADFGLAMKDYDHTVVKLGTYGYRAPEIEYDKLNQNN